MAINENVKIKVDTVVDDKGIGQLTNSINQLDKSVSKTKQSFSGLEKESKKVKTPEGLSNLKGLNAISSGIGGLTSGLGGLTSGLGGLTSGLGGLTSGLGGMTAGLGGMTAGLGAAAVAAGVLSVKLFDTIKVGADFKVLHDSFQGTAEQLEEMRKASAGNLNDATLIEYANSMRLLGQNTDTTTKLLDIAERRGDEVGVTFDKANDALKSFIITGAARGLVDLGINVAKVEEEMTKLSGKTSEQISSLSEMEQQQLRANAVLSLFGDSMENIRTKSPGLEDMMQSLSVQYDNFKHYVGLAVVENTNFLKSLDGLPAIGQSWGDILGRMIANTLNLAQVIGEVALAIGDPAKLTALWTKYTSEQTKVEFAFHSTKSAPIKNPTKGKTTSANTVKQQEEMLNDLQRKQKALNDLLALESTFTEQDRGQLHYLSWLEKVRDLKKEIAAYMLPIDILNVHDIQPATVEQEQSSITADTTFIPGEKKKTTQQLRDELLASFAAAGSSLSNILNTLNVGTETAFAKAVSYVEDIASIFQNIVSFLNSVNSVSSLISSLTGILSPTPAPLINNINPAPVVNNFFKVDLNTMQVVKDGLPKYMDYKNSIRV